MQNAGTPSNRKWLIMTPPEYALPVYRWQLEALAFFDHIVYGADNGYATQAPVRYYVTEHPRESIAGRRRSRFQANEKVRFTCRRVERMQLLTSLDGGFAGGRKEFVGRGTVWSHCPPELDEVANPILTFEAA